MLSAPPPLALSRLTGGARARPRRGGAGAPRRSTAACARGTADVGRRRRRARRRLPAGGALPRAAPSSRCPLRRRASFDPAAAPAFGGEQVITAAQWAIFDQDSARVVRTLLDGENHYVAALHWLACSGAGRRRAATRTEW